MSNKNVSNTLIIRHISSDLEVSERVDFLRHFGAKKVWFINPKSHTAFALFDSGASASEALFRLHQLEFLGKRLSVEYSFDHSDAKPSTIQHNTKDTDLPFQKFLKSLVGWNPSLNIDQPPLPSVRYKYPKASAHILFNMAYAMSSNVPLYVQTLHLMNKIGLDPPFHDITSTVKDFVMDSLDKVNIKIYPPPLPSTQYPQNVQSNAKEQVKVSSEESEISSDENESFPEVIPALPTKRKSKLKRVNKRPKILIEPYINTTKRTVMYEPQEVFEDIVLCETKRIEVKVNKGILDNLQKQDGTNSTEVVGVIGKMLPPPFKEKDDQSTAMNTTPHSPTTVITTKELMDNRISTTDMKSLPIFKNYHPGTPSMRLYIKNLSKDVNTEDLNRIYKRYLTDCDFTESEMFFVRLMQEGRMKGQAFVTLPSVDLSERALKETNGFILKNKPMVVQFARTAKPTNTHT